MSILVKGMDMPHDCFECPFSISPISDDSPFWMCGWNAMPIHEADTEECRPNGCPLEEVRMSILITNKAAKAGDGGFAIHLYDDVYIDSECVDAAFDAVFLKGGEKYCDRNICTKNEYNGIGCDECVVGKEKK